MKKLDKFDWLLVGFTAAMIGVLAFAVYLDVTLGHIK